MKLTELFLELLPEVLRKQPGFDYNEERIYKELNGSEIAYSNLGIKILSIIGGILGTSFFLAFLGALVWQSETSCFVLGAVLLLLAMFTTKLSGNTFAQTAILCAYISGLVLVSIGVNDAGPNVIPLLLIVISTISLFFSAGFLMPFINTLVFNGSLFALIVINNESWAIHLFYAYALLLFILLTHLEGTFLSNGEKLNRLYSPVRSAFLFTLIGALATLSMSFLVDGIPYRWISSIFTLAAILLIIHYILDALQIKKLAYRVFLCLTVLIILLPAMMAPAILGALLILLVSYQYGHRTGFWAGLLAFVFFVSRYYYDLELNLLHKAALMLASGFLFLITFTILKKKLRHED